MFSIRHALRQSLFYMIAAAASLAAAGCQDLTGIEGDIDNLKDKVSDLEQSIDGLWKAYDAGKLITSVEADAPAGAVLGYRIFFSDGSSIMVYNGATGETGKDGADAVAPMVKIDGEGYWCVSYDGGLTYDRMSDADGNPIFSRGADGKDGENGKDGAAGICVRVVVNDEGYYTFELYSPDAPATVIETIGTHYTSDPSQVMQSIVEDDNTGVITLTLADGTAVNFNLDVTYPTSIVVLTDRVNIPPSGQATFEFRVNPSNARFVPIVSGEAANLQLDMVGSRAVSYVTAPDNYRPVSVERSVNAAGEVKPGQYTVTVEEAEDAPEVYSENVVVVLTTRDGHGEEIQLSSSLVEFCSSPMPELITMKVGRVAAEEIADGVLQLQMPYGAKVNALQPTYKTNGARIMVKDIDGSTRDATTVDLSSPVTLTAISDEGRTRDYRVAVVYSNLPTVYLSTPSYIDSKEEWTKGCTIDIWNAEDMSRTYESVQIKGRGNSTWGYAKKPYAIKLDSKAEVLGMPRHKRWVLLANYLDVTCMRNAVAFEIARQLDGLSWTPRGEFVDVVMNGQLIGNYYLCEQIKIDKNRLDLTEISPEDTDEYAITGGYLLEMDTNYDEQYKFRTKTRNLPVQFKDPDEDITPQQFEYVENYFNKVEELLYNGDTTSNEVFDYIDIDSYVDWWLVHEVTKNIEPTHPKSCYMHKDRGGKLTAGPVWDFDWATFVNTTSKFIDANAIWYTPLFKNKTFIARVKQRWAANKARLEQVAAFIDDTAALIRESAEGNKIMWPVSGSPNYDGTLSFSSAASQLKQNYLKRLDTIGAAIEAL